MFNRTDKNQISEQRVAEIERVVQQHGEMLNAVKDHLINNFDEIGAALTAISTAIYSLPKEQQQVISEVLSGLVRDADDQVQAAKMRAIFEKRLLVTITD